MPRQLLAIALLFLLSGCTRQEGQPTAVRSTPRPDVTLSRPDVTLCFVLNDLLIAEADAAAGLIEHTELERKRNVFLAEASKRPSKLLPYAVGDTRRAKLALGLLKRIEGVDFVRRGKEGQVWPDLDAWREHFKRKNAEFAAQERKKDEMLASARAALDQFLGALACGNVAEAYELVASSSKKKGDPVAYNAPLDPETFSDEVAKVPAAKFANAKITAGWVRSPREAIFTVKMIYSRGIDNNEVQLTFEQNRWVILNPISVIR